MQRTSGEKEPLARLTFNAAAAREYFADSQGIKMRIERGVVAFRPTRSVRGVDVIAISRRVRGVSLDLPDAKMERRLMLRLFRAGLTEASPYFMLEPAGRGWFGIDHAEDKPSGSKPTLVVSNFEPPLVPIDMVVWHRFRRAITSGTEISEELWTRVRDVVRSAVRLTLQPQHGRVSQERIAAGRLLLGIEQNLEPLAEWRQRQPDYGNELASFLRLAGIQVNTADIIPLRRDNQGVTHISREFVDQVVHRQQAEPEGEPEGEPRKKHKAKAPKTAEPVLKEIDRDFPDWLTPTPDEAASADTLDSDPEPEETEAVDVPSADPEEVSEHEGSIEGVPEEEHLPAEEFIEQAHNDDEPPGVGEQPNVEKDH